MTIVQLILLIILLGLEIYNLRMQRETTRRLNSLLDDHGQRPVDIPVDPHASMHRVMEGLTRHAHSKRAAQ